MDFHARKINLFRAVSAAIIKISSGFIVGLLLLLQYSHAATIQISSVNSTGCTLVDAIKSANANNASGTTCATSAIGLFGDDIISFPVSPPGVGVIWDAFIDEVNYTTNGRTGLPAITSNITIEGQNLSIRGYGSSLRIFYIETGGELTLNDLNLLGGEATDNSYGTPTQEDFGGAIYNKGRLNINRSTIEDNTAEIGAGIHNIGILTIKHSQILNNNGSGIDNQGTLNLIDSTVQNNNSGNRSGGGIANTSSGTASILRTLFLMNQSAWGGGLYNSATITVRDSTFSGNLSNNSGGGLYTGGYMGGTASMTLINVTISHNIAADGGGGINQNQGTLNLVNTLISGNFSLGAGTGAEVYRRSGIQGKQMNNLFGHSGLSNTQAFSGFSIAASDITATINGTTPTDLAQIISPLDKHGGPTSTFALVPNSPAIDAAVSTYGPIFFPDEGCYSPGIPGLFDGTYRDDQRGVERPQEGACDIGAYEYEASGFFIIPTLNGKTVIFAL